MLEFEMFLSAVYFLAVQCQNTLYIEGIAYLLEGAKQDLCLALLHSNPHARR